jgi:pimeloyl-ACP methyl ester carboxylesterase
LGIRQAFFELNSFLRGEFEQRAKTKGRLAMIRTPIFIVFGNEDPYLTPALGRELHGLLGNSRIEVVEGAGHYVQLDKPDPVAQAILKASGSNFICLCSDQ